MGENNEITMITMICNKFYDRVMYKMLWTHRNATLNYITEDKSQTIEVKAA